MMEINTILKENKQLKAALEKVNGEYLDILESKEYITGRRVLTLIYDVSHFDIVNIIRRVTNYKRKKKYNIHRTQKVKPNIKKGELKLGTKIALYACITGDYDRITEPYFVASNMDCFLYTDTDADMDGSIWKKRKIPDYIKKLGLTNLEINRYIKMHPYELFPDYDYTVYIDGKVTIVSDISQMVRTVQGYYGIGMHRHSYRDDLYEEAEACIAYKKGLKKMTKEQIKQYKIQGMPRQFGMREAAVIICDLGNNQGRELMDAWWNDYYERKSGRDQLSLPYVIWKMGKRIEDIDIIDAECIENNNMIRINGLH